jgi:hypothetical protein
MFITVSSRISFTKAQITLNPFEENAVFSFK